MGKLRGKRKRGTSSNPATHTQTKKARHTQQELSKKKREKVQKGDTEERLGEKLGVLFGIERKGEVGMVKLT